MAISTSPMKTFRGSMRKANDALFHNLDILRRREVRAWRYITTMALSGALSIARIVDRS